jgi:hypothetical protein
MKLTKTYADFCNSWLEEASKLGTNKRDVYSKSFYLYIVYNIMYNELARLEAIRNGYTGWSDKKAATDLVRRKLTCKKIVATLEADAQCNASINAIKTLLLDERSHFSLKLPKLEPIPKDDKSFREKLQSKSVGDRCEALLDVLYCIRCNLFHGSKPYTSGQATDVLQHFNILIAGLIKLLQAHLDKAE